MKTLGALGFAGAALFTFCCQGQEPALKPPGIGKVEILRTAEIKAGMQGVAWTVFQGTEPEPIPVEIIGLYKNAAGPKQDIILGKLGGKAIRTNVAGGMSGSPVYIDGKLAGAISTRISVLSPDAICGITPIELMLEVSEFDDSRPQSSQAPGGLQAQSAAGGLAGISGQAAVMSPIETPLVFSGFESSVLREVSPLFQQYGLSVVQGGASGALRDSTPAPGWEQSLRPGELVAAVLVSGDMTVSGQGTVTYNDGRRVLAFGHSLLKLGPVSMPMSKGEVLMTLASSLQPNKFANATQIVGALRQDRHSAILGVLGEQAQMIPVSVTVRSLAEDGSVRGEKRFQYSVAVHEKYTPTLMMTTLYNSISGVNEFGDQNTYRLQGTVELEGGQSLSLATMQAPSEIPSPASLLLAGWVGDRFNRLFTNAVTSPKFRRVDVSVDLLPDRRVAAIESAWLSTSEVEAGDELPLKVFLRPFRGPRLEREMRFRIPSGLTRGEYRILLSDADALNRMQSAAGRANRFIDLSRAISLINQERANNQVYASLLSAGSTVYYDDKILPSLPPSVLNVMQASPSASRSFVTSRETTLEQTSIPMDWVVTGSYALTIRVK
ncbi:MAG TPA: hypothetical protein VLH09_01715 [Bryobacteraceae bacterium]|nr:hypothetical protein [Bryobacteraceae bacterium]